MKCLIIDNKAVAADSIDTINVVSSTTSNSHSVNLKVNGTIIHVFSDTDINKVKNVFNELCSSLFEQIKLEDILNNANKVIEVKPKTVARNRKRGASNDQQKQDNQ